MRKLASLCVSPSHTLREVMLCINQNAHGIALVVDSQGRLLDTITDGDLRRAILAGVELHLPVSLLMARRKGSSNPAPVTAATGTSATELLRLMEECGVQQIPLLNENGAVAGLVTLRDLLGNSDERDAGLSALVMAGGLGERLRPVTEDVPKPMLPVNGKPLLEHTIEQLRAAGISQINVSTHYKSDVVSNHFGDGSEFGVKISYVHEDEPLGTAGALAALQHTNTPLLVINGDVLTNLNYRAMLAYHFENQAQMTVGLRQYDFRVPYGVVQTEGVQVRAIAEKPMQKLFVNAGIYLLEPDLARYVPPGRRFDMTELIAVLLAEGVRVIGFPISEYWIDIGQPADYERAKLDARKGAVGA